MGALKKDMVIERWDVWKRRCREQGEKPGGGIQGGRESELVQMMLQFRTELSQEGLKGIEARRRAVDVEISHFI
jgi:hypothetical protein